MRKVTQQITDAFLNGIEKRNGNSYTDGKAMFLHGNKIAEKKGGRDLHLKCGMAYKHHQRKTEFNSKRVPYSKERTMDLKRSKMEWRLDQSITLFGILAGSIPAMGSTI